MSNKIIKYNKKYVGGVHVDNDTYIFKKACKFGDLDTVKYLVSQGVDANCSGLQLACKYGHLDVVIYLMLQLYKMHPNDYGVYLICSYSGYTTVDVIKFLIEAGEMDIYYKHVESIDNLAITRHLKMLGYY